jgi:hypothetical protein
MYSMSSNFSSIVGTAFSSAVLARYGWYLALSSRLSRLSVSTWGINSTDGADRRSALPRRWSLWQYWFVESANFLLPHTPRTRMLSITLPISALSALLHRIPETYLDFPFMTPITGAPDCLWSIGNTSSGGPHLIYQCLTEKLINLNGSMYILS